MVHLTSSAKLATAIALLSSYSSFVSAQKPAAIYDGNLPDGNPGSVELTIGNGGAGQSGLVKALADAFIQESVSQNNSQPFKAAWYTSDTTYTINYLKSGLLDVGITYSPSAESIAIAQGIAKSPSFYAFRDHFLFVGPPSNPANISASDDISTQFSDLHEAAEKALAEGLSPPEAPRFLSRFDKSATNIKETLLWAGIGQVPWATAYSTWYHQYIQFPLQALTAAILLDEYTITDRGTILSLQNEDAGLVNRTKIYKAGSDRADDLLLNPAHLLVGTKAPNMERAEAFAAWVVSQEGGQKVIEGFKKQGVQLYTPAPAEKGKAHMKGTGEGGLDLELKIGAA